MTTKTTTDWQQALIGLLENGLTESQNPHLGEIEVDWGRYAIAMREAGFRNTSEIQIRDAIETLVQPSQAEQDSLERR